MWLNSLFGKRALRSSSPRPGCVPRSGAGFRPRLEALEDRLAPATLTVTTAVDGVAGSLRAAIQVANADAANGISDTINFAPALAGATLTLTQGQLHLSGAGTGTITINGGAAGVTLDGNNLTRIFQIDSGVRVELVRLNVINGMIPYNGTPQNGPEAPGGGILNWGTLTVDACTLSGNSANDGTVGGPGLGGGALCNFGTATVTGSTFSNNSASLIFGTDGIATGGAIFNASSGTMVISNSTLSGNTAAHEGGAIISGGLLSISNSTLSGNTSGRSGGAIATSSGTLTLNGCTFTNNSAQDGGGAVYVDPTVAKIVACIFSGNSAPVGADLYNLESTVTVIDSDGDFFTNGGTTTKLSIDDLVTQVTALNLSAGLTNSLTSKLRAAQQSLANSNTTAAVNQLSAFINQINALVNSHRLGVMDANTLTGEVEALINLIQ